MRLETVQESEGVGLEPLIFAIAGLISGFSCWWLMKTDNFPGFLDFKNVPTGVQRADINLWPAVIFASLLAVAFFLSGSASYLNPNPVIWVGAYLGTIMLYFIVLWLLTFGYLSQLFRLTHELFWINLMLSGMFGAAVLSFFAGTLIGQANGRLMIAMIICGGLSGLTVVGFMGKVGPFMLFPWWHFSQATLIGFWVSSAMEEEE
jgi:hypothetical protein